MAIRWDYCLLVAIYWSIIFLFGCDLLLLLVQLEGNFRRRRTVRTCWTHDARFLLDCSSINLDQNAEFRNSRHRFGHQMQTNSSSSPIGSLAFRFLFTFWVFGWCYESISSSKGSYCWLLSQEMLGVSSIVVWALLAKDHLCSLCESSVDHRRTRQKD